MWYTHSYRRHLCDMHIDDWHEAFLSRYSPEEHVRLLKLAKAQTVMLYYQSHVGLCYFPDSDGLLHRAFIGREDTMRRTEQLCHENGISVVGYYSLIFNNRVTQRHPEWEMYYPDGETAGQKGKRYLKCCPNHKGYREFVFKQIREMLAYFNPDGMFYDMPYWPQPCHCSACRARWEKEHGGEMPVEPDDPRMPLLDHARMRWMQEFAEEVSAYTRSLRPGLTIEYNCAYAALPSMEPAISEGVLRAGDYVGGDLYDDAVSQSIICKYYADVSCKLPFEYMTCRCMPNLQNHTVTKSLVRLKQAALITLSHQGASLFIDAIDPEGTMDERVYRRLGEVADATMPYEPFVRGRRIAKAGVVYLQQCKQNPAGSALNHYKGIFTTVETLMRAHIPVDVVSRASFEHLDRYSALILPEPAWLDEEAVRLLKDYVHTGGTLYFSGAGDGRLLQTLTGGTLEGCSEDRYTYLAPCGEGCALMSDFSDAYPLPFEARMPLVNGIAPEYLLATVTLPYQLPKADSFVSIHSNPPGFATKHPGLARIPFGEGTVIWSAVPIESMAVIDYRRIFINLFAGALQRGGLELISNAPATVELMAVMSAEGALRISAIDLRDMDEEEIVPGFTISLSCGPVRQVRLLPKGEPVAYRYEAGRLTFEARPLNIFDMYEIEFL